MKIRHVFGGGIEMKKCISLFFVFICYISISHAEGKNPYKDGVEKIILTEQELEDIKSYVVNSKFLLEEALKKAEGKNINKQIVIYHSVIREVVLYSYKNKGYDELLMRMILNQSLELVFGVPKSDGIGYVKKGLLNNLVSDDLIVSILKDHIVMAKDNAKIDLESLESGDPFNVFSFNEVALKKLAMNVKWIAGIFSVELQNKVYQLAIDRFISTVKRDENLMQKNVNEIIYYIYELERSNYFDIYKKNRAYRVLFNTLPVQLPFHVSSNKTNHNKDVYNSLGDQYETSKGNECEVGYVEGRYYHGPSDQDYKICLSISSLKDKYETLRAADCASGYTEGRSYPPPNGSGYYYKICRKSASLKSKYETSKGNECEVGYVEGRYYHGPSNQDYKICLSIPSLKDMYETLRGGECASGYTEGRSYPPPGGSGFYFKECLKSGDL